MHRTLSLDLPVLTSPVSAVCGVLLCDFLVCRLLQERRLGRQDGTGPAFTPPYTLGVRQAALCGVLVAHMPGRLADKVSDSAALPQRSAVQIFAFNKRTQVHRG